MNDKTLTLIGNVFTVLVLLALFVMLGAMVYGTHQLGQRIDQLNDRQEHHPIDRIDRTPIESLKDGSNVEGTFYYGSGVVDAHDVYIYYTKKPDGGYVRNSIDASQTTIYTDEDANPYLISHYVETNRLHVQFINSYDLHVPNGTVPKKYGV